MRRYRKLGCLLIALMSIKASAQKLSLDSLQVKAGVEFSGAGKDYQPFWLISNRYGVYTDRQLDATFHIQATNKQLLGTPSRDMRDTASAISVAYGADLYLNNQFKSLVIAEAYLRAGYKGWELRGGRFRHSSGSPDQEVSSGSLGMSGNALPIPGITLGMADYKNVPFTGGWLQVKADISHGWMGNKQFMKDAFLHEKSLYLRAGKNKLKLFGGLQHYAVWGGRRSDWISLDRSINGFFNVLLVREADDGSVYDGQFNPGNIQVRPNRPGDHRGVIEAGAEWENDAVLIRAYHQTPFEMGQGISLKNVDQLLGVTLINHQPEGFLRKLAVEFISTKQMNSFYISAVRESYYNNGIYATGWEYNDKIIGTPLFIDRVRGSNYFPDVKPYDWDAPIETIKGNDNIISNRIMGGHLGLVSRLNQRVSFRTMLTYTQNYGTYDIVYSPHKNQFYGLQEAVYQLKEKNLSISAGIGIDSGQLTNNVGGRIGVEWRLRTER